MTLIHFMYIKKSTLFSKLWGGNNLLLASPFSCPGRYVDTSAGSLPTLPTQIDPQEQHGKGYMDWS